ncbi:MULTISPECIES: disulfide bond formation protein DsbB [Tatumella]|uniref:Disulfide bond formation protein B n=1 Tax=Tatumella punctata TaxID=399969 RepID=A0ABW1VHK9_9GAMM|nr:MULTISPECIES: disulfide bond formation protein DsbB [unclassified Tatumella]MBS0855360.1 disulfide bond formation protein DsbB [Tatumella sp. JGM16]MBS0877270.1 disulfide bond formation protein DsbB [Tatumella sp. JGM82]MBS0889361.1 disulfide bond formation protein DsbB [Tatumella sp. JGM94]MBS0894091.1 disulfide bond formation protein DsbB [Tatumella sp. JGM130]MBS0901667.1 disulfide bond formation protein DsbB [Tatumella sp. JGM100]
MLRLLNRCSKGRSAWALLALTALALELTALWFQHVMGLKPCVMCIYERCALLGVLLAGIVGAIAPATPLRFVGIIGWLIAAGEGLRLSWEHTMLQLHPPLFATCDFMARFPSWLRLDKWVPGMFVASGDCLDRSWTLFSLSMPQWLVVVFAVYLLIGVLVFIAQLKNFSRQR